MWFRLWPDGDWPKWHSTDRHSGYDHYGDCGRRYKQGLCDTREDDPPVEESCKACLKLLAKEES